MHLSILFYIFLVKPQLQLHRELSLKSPVPALGFPCSCFLWQEFCTEALLRRAVTHIPRAARQRGCVCLVPCGWRPAHSRSGSVPEVWCGLCFAHSMGSCWMRDRPTPTSTCTSGQQRRRTTLGWWSRWRCVKLKVRGEKEAGEGA